MDARAIRAEGQLERVKLIYTIPGARQSDRDQPRRRASPTVGGAGAEMVEDGTGFSCWRIPHIVAFGFEGAEPPSLWSLDEQRIPSSWPERSAKP